MKTQSNADRIVFLSVPESLRGKIETSSKDDASSESNFSIDPAIPIPVEIPHDIFRGK